MKSCSLWAQSFRVHWNIFILSGFRAWTKQIGMAVWIWIYDDMHCVEKNCIRLGCPMKKNKISFNLKTEVVLIIYTRKPYRKVQQSRHFSVPWLLISVDKETSITMKNKNDVFVCFSLNNNNNKNMHTIIILILLYRIPLRSFMETCYTL